ncbi:MAG TPA: hypothetical protein VLB09_04535 [Nitrospiria bacterium]|nr:hypothetical protein [Nitrospiria bacterium]
MQKTIGAAIVMTGFLIALAAPAAMACSGAGKDRHIGNVTELNPGALTLTILDAETQKPLTFRAHESEIAKLKESDRVMIDYKEEEGELVAVRIRTAS